MPCKLKVKIIAGRNLPVMDRSSDTTDAFVEVKFGVVSHKTDVCRKSLHPYWNSEWYQFEVGDSDLQDEPLRIRLMDYDTYSANDSIGKVYVDLNPLLSARSDSAWLSKNANSDTIHKSVITGWIPVYDTMNGIRGEINIAIKIHLFTDSNRFRESSCGVLFFSSTSISSGLVTQKIYGFVSELVINDDPEYQWIDKIRTPRASNEAKQMLFYKLSGELKRRLGVKAFEAGGNAVVGYQQHFDLEGESGIVARGSGTIVTITSALNNCIAIKAPVIGFNTQWSTSAIQRRLSESDVDHFKDYSGAGLPSKIPTSILPDNFDMWEYPLLTLSTYPNNFIMQLGGCVTARSVKVLERITSKEDLESRDSWWRELRTEIRAHARSYNCNAVLGYTETTSICEGVCVLSATGTAACVASLSALKNTERRYNATTYGGERDRQLAKSCRICHLPYTKSGSTVRNCALCQTAKVTELFIGTIECPQYVPRKGRAAFIQVFVCRQLKEARGSESIAKEISDGLPFLEYELHRSLDSKVKIKGMNAIFGLNVRIAMSERLLVAVATGTAVFLTPLWPPRTLRILPDRYRPHSRRLAALQKNVRTCIKANRDFYGISPSTADSLSPSSSSETNEQQLVPANEDAISAISEDCCIIEIDDPSDTDALQYLIEQTPIHGFQMVNTEHFPGAEPTHLDGANAQMFMQISRIKSLSTAQGFDEQFQRLLKCVCYKLRRLIPCILCKLNFRVGIGELEDLQLNVMGIAVTVKDEHQMYNLSPKKTSHSSQSSWGGGNTVFHMEEDSSNVTKQTNDTIAKESLHTAVKHKNAASFGVNITPLAHIPCTTVKRYFGNVNYFFIRETTSIREDGGVNLFMHTFVTEVLAVVRAHITALGGNALLSYCITDCVLTQNVRKNQSQYLISVSGDAVSLLYDDE